ncbi:hypothetical protein L596_030425 [Steinernema carpocapsae]|uniref:Peptidase S1 domain-containing protein n=1 Tax=Steinernema carpocapsae TaxID=34508 RepID=A0A4U5LPD9_STECR|nr:hypothetical protein L596_030425 [Steinernema carpocapsae]
MSLLLSKDVVAERSGYKLFSARETSRGLIPLSSPVDFTATAQPAKILRDDSRVVVKHGQVIFMGFGSTAFHDNKPNAFSDNLLETGVVVAKFDYCQRTLPKIATDNDKIVCTVGPHGTHGAGAGESGGPLVAQDGKGVVQVGMLIGATNSDEKLRWPDVYLRTSYFCDFFAQATGNAFSCS